MNVLLLWPRFQSGLFWRDANALRIIGRKADSPPLGLITVAAMLPADWRKRLVDTNIADLTEEDIRWADIAFISAYHVQKDSAGRLISRCKAAGLKVVAGGPLFNWEHDTFNEVDHFVLNEAELTLPSFLREFESGGAKRMYASGSFADLLETPVPLFELLDLDQYAFMYVQVSRGCPFDCEFCSVSSLFGRRYRHKSAGQIIAELSKLYIMGWRGPIYFADDNLIGNKKFIKSVLLPEIIKWRKNKNDIVFHAEVSIDLSDDPQLIDLMARSGFDSVFFGIETVTESGLTEIKKTQNLNRNLLESVRRVQRAGLEVIGGFIVGLDNDTPDIFRQQSEFIQKSGIVVAFVNALYALPGTRLNERLQKEQRVRNVNEGLPGNRNAGDTNIIPKMGLQPFRSGFAQLLMAIYTPARYCERVRIFLNEARHPAAKISPMVYGPAAFLRSLIHLAIRQKGKRHYWKLLIWTLRHHPGMLPKALKFAIFGHHYQEFAIACNDRINRTGRAA